MVNVKSVEGLILKNGEIVKTMSSIRDYDDKGYAETYDVTLERCSFDVEDGDVITKQYVITDNFGRKIIDEDIYTFKSKSSNTLESDHDSVGRYRIELPTLEEEGDVVS